MKNDFINIVQKCVHVDFILSNLINSDYLDYKKFLISIKNENLRNIKILIYLYESCHQDTIAIKNIDNIGTFEINNNYFPILIEHNFSIINNLEKLKTASFDNLCHQLLNSLITSYFNFISLIHCFCSINSIDESFHMLSRDNIYNISNFSKLSMDGLSIVDIDSIDVNNITYELIRDIALESIQLFFNYELSDNLIVDEHYEIFFKNNPENKFYQLFFTSDKKSFKIRILEKDLKVFYLYQTSFDNAKVTPALTQDEAKAFSDAYLIEKLVDEYKYLKFDSNYLNIYSYMNLPESYKFKYNIKYHIPNSKTNKNLYVTVDSRYINICEILFL